MYLSVIAKGRVHVPDSDGFKVVEPDPDHDPLRLRPALDYLVKQIAEARGKRLPVTTLLASLKNRPYGVRKGLGPLLLAVILQTRSHEVAIYENGTFLHEFGPSDFLRLTKAPATFQIQHCKVDGVRLEVFNQLAISLARKVNARHPDLLDVVQPLCQFAAQLPDYTRRTTALSKVAIDVRHALLSAREPVTLVFSDLPQACCFPPFSPQEQPDEGCVNGFVSVFRDALGELRQAYPALLSRIIERVAQAAGEERGAFDRVHLATRAARVSLAAREPRLRTFALRLRDPGLSDDAWAEALASFVVSKPPARWASGDEARFCEEIAALAELFQKLEAAAFGAGREAPALSAVRLNLTRGDGIDLVRIIEPRTEDESGIQCSLSGFEKMLPQDRHTRLDVLTRLLWNEVSASDSLDSAKDRSPISNRKRRVNDDGNHRLPKKTISRPQEVETRHVLSLSGGKDSAALAIYMRDRVPEMEYVFHDTDKELPETYDYLDRLAAILGKPIAKTSAVDTFDHWLVVYGGMLPSNHRRWCTKMLKIKPFENFVGDRSGHQLRRPSRRREPGRLHQHQT